MGRKLINGPTINLGYLELDIESNDPLELTDDDLALVTAEILETGGGIVAIPSSRSYRSIEPLRYQNQLAQNYPNPFNPTTTIAFSIAEVSDVKLAIYGVRGELVRTLVDGRRAPNNYRVIWDGKNNAGNFVASGVYFYRLIAGDFKATKKMVLLR